MHYTSHWRLSFILALVVHFFLWSGATFLLPLLAPEPPLIAEGTEIMLEDIPLATEEEVPAEEEPGTEDGSAKGEPDDGEGTLSAAEAAALAAALKDIPDNAAVSAAAPPGTVGPVTESDVAGKPEEPKKKEPEKKPEEKKPEEEKPLDKDVAVITEDEAEAIRELKRQIEEAEKNPDGSVSTIVVRRKGTGGQMGQPARLIADSYPATGVNFHGRVSVFATIGKDGNVRKTKVAVTSGRRSIDEIAMAACRRWRFKPALDHNGQPMECVQIISIPFNVPNIDRQVLERYRAEKLRGKG
ncbi:MAG: TonB family protein [Acidaminococcaceae bacterium]|nr:TonB family protein [Acidaminococcaceae bacterium]